MLSEKSGAIGKGTLMLVGIAAMGGASVARAADVPQQWQIRLLGSYVSIQDKVGSVRINGVPVVGADLKVDDPVIPATTITRSLGEHFAVELFCCIARVDVDGKGSLAGAHIARTTFFAPALTAIYRFGTAGKVQPYVGAGGQALFFFNTDARLVGFTDAKVDTAFGPTLQAGIDIPVSQSFTLNVDIKKSFYSTDAKLTGGGSTVRANNIKLDPLIVSAGVGFRF